MLLSCRLARFVCPSALVRLISGRLRFDRALESLTLGSIGLRVGRHPSPPPLAHSRDYPTQVTAVTLFQMAMCYVVKDFSWGWIFGLGWVISGFANQNLFCAQVRL